MQYLLIVQYFNVLVLVGVMVLVWSTVMRGAGCNWILVEKEIV